MRILILIAVALMTGCVQSHKMQSQFHGSDFTRYAATGDCTLTGQAFMRTRGGDVKYAAGSRVLLIESNKYTDELFGVRMRGLAIDKSSVSPQIRMYARETTGNGEGRFTFGHLPAGDYYVFTKIEWQISKYRKSGGEVYKKVRVAKGDSSEIILTR